MPISETYNQDCLAAMHEMADKCFDLAIVDPPYGIGESNAKFNSRCVRNGRLRVKTDRRNGSNYVIALPAYNQNKAWDSKQPEQVYFDEVCRVSKHQIIWGCNYLVFNQKNFSSGRIFWDKVNGSNDFSDGEIAWTNLFNSIRKFEYLWNGMLQAKSLIEPRTTQGNKKLCEKRIHPTQKPVALYKWLLTNYAKQGDRILDTHLGSGSSRIAAYDLGFDFTGFEFDADYYNAQEERFQRHIAQPKLFEPVRIEAKQEGLFTL